jgi:hypothetical protein
MASGKSHKLWLLPKNNYQHAGSPLLLPESKLLEYCLVTTQVLVVEVIQELFALANQLQQRTATGMVFAVGLQVFRQALDPGGKQCNLAFRTACIGLGTTELLKNISSLFF